jgi:DNA polymerase III epsilon subunit family exonuclease
MFYKGSDDIGTCKLCIKSGLFFKVNNAGLCPSCMYKIQIDVGPIVQKLQYDMNAFDKYNREDIKYDRANRMIPNLQQLLKYEDMGIPILNGKVGTVALAISRLTEFVDTYIETSLINYEFKIKTKKSAREFLKKGKYVVVDFETTGFNPQKDKIIEIGIVKTANGIIIDTLDMLINPGIRIPKEIVKKTGISDELVKNMLHINDVIEQVREFISDNYFIAHNVVFDASFYKVALGGTLPETFTTIDTLYMARHLYPDLMNHKLDTLIRMFNLPVENRHRALSDALSTQALFEKCISDILK